MQVTFYTTSSAEQQRSNKEFSYKEVESKQCLAEFVEVKKKLGENLATKGLNAFKSLFVRSSLMPTNR